MIKTKFENFDFFKDSDDDNKKPFIFAIRDCEKKDEERFVLASMSEEEAKRFWLILGEYFN